jgi:lysophospholipase L1-like esterase
MKRIAKLAVFFAFLGILFAQTSPPPFVALGDSLSEGVQSADANAATQPQSYLARFAAQMGVAFPLPLIRTSPTGVVGSTNGRSRWNASLAASNLAVSGADTGSILSDAAGQPIDDEIDLVEQPRTGTQVQIAQQLQAPFAVCWIGANDVLSAVLSFNQLNATQITPLPVFQANFQQIVTSLTGWNNKVVFANIPDVTQVGFVFSPQDLQLFLGNSYGLPDGSYTTLVAMLLIRLGLVQPSVLQNPDWVLDPAEVQTIRNAVNSFNQVIAQDAASVNMPVVDIHGLFSYLVQHPITIGGVTLLPRFNGGIFSLDGVHPANTAHAVVANAFIRQVNSFWGMNIPLISQQQMLGILHNDPFIDFNGNLVVRGRPYHGLLETLGPSLGISGDSQDAKIAPGIHPELGPRFMRAYFAATGQNPDRSWNTDDAVAAMRHVLGLNARRGL